jgi:hypothetical protein
LWDRIFNGTATAADWAALATIVGTAGSVFGNIYGPYQQNKTLRDLADQQRADRAPFLQKGTEWLNNPQAYTEGPGQQFMDSTLRSLSASHGNPVSSPTAMSLATQAGMQDWRNAWSSAGSLGLGGQGIQADLGAGAAQAKNNMWGGIGGGLGSLSDLFEQYNLMIGGTRT